jgi:perosamine synthetase
VCWLFSVCLDTRYRGQRDAVMGLMHEAGIETRPFFYPVHTLPPYREPRQPALPVAEWLGARGMNLPTWVGMTRDHVHRVGVALKEALEMSAEAVGISA